MDSGRLAIRPRRTSDFGMGRAAPALGGGKRAEERPSSPQGPFAAFRAGVLGRAGRPSPVAARSGRGGLPGPRGLGKPVVRAASRRTRERPARAGRRTTGASEAPSEARTGPRPSGVFAVKRARNSANARSAVRSPFFGCSRQVFRPSATARRFPRRETRARKMEIPRAECPCGSAGFSLPGSRARRAARAARPSAQARAARFSAARRSCASIRLMLARHHVSPMKRNDARFFPPLDKGKRCTPVCPK